MTNTVSVIDKNSDPRLRPLEAVKYWSSFVGEHYLRLPSFGRVRDAVASELSRRDLPERGKIQIPKLDPAAITPEEYRRNYLRPNIPIILKGAAANWPAVQKWTPEFFQLNYGSEKVAVRFKTEGVGVESVYIKDVTLSELIDNVRDGGEYYASNLEDLFNDNPELRADLSLREVERYSSAHALPGKKKWSIPRKGQILSTQLFISSAKGRAGYHCASGGNFFVQVYGRKRWIFVNARHTPFMYPAIRKDFFYSSSPVDDRLERDELSAEGYGLYNAVPKYEVVLDPGDVLLSPQWWWHAVDNLGLSIGVALRFPTGLFAGNPIYSAMTMLSPPLWRHYFNIVRTGWGADATVARRIFEPEGAEVRMRFSSSKGIPAKSKAADR